MKKMNKMMLGILAMGLTTAVAMNTVMTVKMYQMFNEANEWEAEQEENGTTENDVTIGYDYQILDTSAISDAYRNGDTKNLDEQQLETLEMAKAVINEVTTDSMNDYEKELAIYDWMVDHIAHDSGSVVAIPSRGQSPDRPYSVLKNHQAVCVGYATTFRMFMQMMNIECMVVHDMDNIHSWNMVKLDGEWYITDVYSDVAGARYFNFNVSENEFVQRQKWDTEFFPTAQGMKYNYAAMNHKDLKDIFELPKYIKELLDAGQSASLFFGIEGGAESDQAQQAAYILEKISEYAYALYDQDGGLYLYNSIIPVNDTETVVGIYVNHMSDRKAVNLDEEDRLKIDMMLDELFGYESGF